jgi:indole-3-glycerol phosphate synthase
VFGQARGWVGGASFDTMGTYLDRIIDAHRAAAAVDTRDLGVLRQAATAAVAATPRRGFRLALTGPGLSVIAEIKRRSPSKGDLAADLSPADVALDYQSGGAVCLSVLTDVDHFGGSVSDLQTARAACTLPVIRKDFTVCEADVLDAAIMGADAVLLIVAALSDDELASFSRTAAACDLDVLWETHDEREVKRCLANGATLIGVNQRDLHTFAVDQERAVRVAEAIPDDVVRVAESGVRGPDDAAILAAAGYDAVLVGESIVTSADRSAAVRALIAAGTGSAR